ncbi:polyprenyl synthetase family protein [Streptomyces natalensis]|uniref:Geranylgeranyl diphosphate synthase n=1 Tax=Streptomyces natalensis ATCC 27448 TaxID=1240678 RepID=A0A0D7CLD1_9ACTN|nr:polyprenyl synthetase family protein [Streptomyces natalensis]KIZ16993.1 geranylgeranyl diphosphate synthase [Streptomyces natalensis ATCC 27448]
MNAPSPPARPLGLADIPARVNAVLYAFLQAKAETADRQHMPADVPQALRRFLDGGGKRLRPLLCVLGHQAAEGHGDDTAVLRIAAGLEMFHAFALIHDDIMDNSATRRGRPTLHRALSLALKDDQMGTSAAILTGDMALAWSDELLHTAGLTEAGDRLETILPLIDTMRTEVMYGQYLDLTGLSRPLTDLEAAWRVIRYKTAKYTCERPLHVGAALAGADTVLLAALTRYALPLGDAFQLRDDLLGVFGNPQHTGKSVLDDLREGKRTVLLALAAQHATPTQQRLLDDLVGDPRLEPQGASRIRDVLEATGARASVEAMITSRYEEALAALDDARIPAHATTALRQIANWATERTS